MNDNKNFKICIPMKRTKIGYVHLENHMFYAESAEETENHARRILEKENAALIEIWRRSEENWSELELEAVISALTGKTFSADSLLA